MKLVVKVWDEQHEITIVQKSKSVWIASGVYMGKPLEVQGRSAASTAAHWRDAARYRGNLVYPSRTLRCVHSLARS